MSQTVAETQAIPPDELVARTVAGALALQEADIYGMMGVRPIEPMPPTTYCGHTLVLVPDKQVSGAFKYRGASAAVLEARNQGFDSVVTVSTGSHGVSLGLAAAKVGMTAIVHVPDTITDPKFAKVSGTGADTVKDGTFTVAKARAQGDKRGVFVHPFANQEVRNGQATLGVELARYLELQGLTGFDEDVIIPVSVAGGSHILGIAGPIAVAKQEGRLGSGVKVVAVYSKSGNVDALAISAEDRDPSNELVLQDPRYVAATHELSDKLVGEALVFLKQQGVEDVESAGALPTAYALAYARRYPHSQGNASQKVAFVLPVSGLNGSPESNAAFLNAADKPKVLAAAGNLAVASKTPAASNGKPNGRRRNLNVLNSPVQR